MQCHFLILIVRRRLSMFEQTIPTPLLADVKTKNQRHRPKMLQATATLNVAALAFAKPIYIFVTTSRTTKTQFTVGSGFAGSARGSAAAVKHERQSRVVFLSAQQNVRGVSLTSAPFCVAIMLLNELLARCCSTVHNRNRSGDFFHQIRKFSLCRRRSYSFWLRAAAYATHIRLPFSV
jgi:hypothetical protein